MTDIPPIIQPPIIQPPVIQPPVIQPPVLESQPPILGGQPVGPVKQVGPVKRPSSIRGRLGKHLFFAACGLGLVGGVLASTSPRPRLLRTAEEVRASADNSVAESVQRIDREMLADLSAHSLTPAPAADWMTVCRRLSLALVGNGMSLEEVRFLETIPEADRVTWWTDYLLKDRRSADYLAERWTRATVGTNQGPFLIFRRRKYVGWMADQFAENKPYDEIVRQLLAAKGAWMDAPQVNFLTATMDDNDNKQPDVIRLAGRTSRSFLAQRIDCLQCHHDYLGNVHFSDSLDALPADLKDNPAGEATANASDKDSAKEDLSREGEQEDFHQLASFFAGVRMENPFVGLRNTDSQYKYRYLNADEDSVVDPKVPYLSHLLPSEGAPRERLSVWVTHPENKAFARAAVNRMWAVLFGKPWIAPIDSIPLRGPFPPGFEELADDFASHGYDMQRLIRVIVQTEAFRRDSRIPDREPTETDEAHWAVFPLTQLRPEQVAAAIHQSCRLKTIDEQSSIIAKLELFGGVNDFTSAYGDKGDDEFDENAITIPQRLLVMNGNYIQERINENPVMNASTRIAQLTDDNKLAVRVIYNAVLNRQPSGDELSVFCEKLEGLRGDDRFHGIEDIYWTLLNSTEFLWNH